MNWSKETARREAHELDGHRSDSIEEMADLYHPAYLRMRKNLLDALDRIEHLEMFEKACQDLCSGCAERLSVRFLHEVNDDA